MANTMLTTLSGWLSWFTGHGRYMRLADCMGGDAAWISLTVALDLSVGVGYVLIARHWARNERVLRDKGVQSALSDMKRIFIFCGLCGYLFIPIKMLWPAWRLYDFFLAVLVFYTWKYALGSRELRVVYEQLDQTERLGIELAKSREDARRRSIFLSSISHDIRTPLNGLCLHAGLAEVYDQSGDSAGLRESLLEIRHCARAAADLLAEFLELGRLDWEGEAVGNDAVALVDPITRAVEASRVASDRKGLRLAYSCPADLILRSDKRLLERILRNLVENAVKYTETGDVRVEVVAGRESVEVHVIDTGVGIAPEHLELVFQDFFQVANRERDRSKGFGLGLSIAGRLARQLGGELAVESQIDRGTRFTLRLPRSVEPEGPIGDFPGSPHSGAVAATSLAR